MNSNNQTKGWKGGFGPAAQFPKSSGSDSPSPSNSPSDPNQSTERFSVESLLKDLEDQIFNKKKSQFFNRIDITGNIQSRVSQLQTQLDKQQERFIGTLDFDDEFMKPYVPSIADPNGDGRTKEEYFDICSQQIKKLFTDGLVPVSKDIEQDKVNAITFLHSRHNRTNLPDAYNYLHKFPIWMSYLLTLINGITYENPKPYAQRFFTFYYDDRNQIEPSFRRGDETETDKVENGERQTEMKTPEEKLQMIKKFYYEQNFVKDGGEIKYWKSEKQAQAMKQNLIDHFDKIIKEKEITKEQIEKHLSNKLEENIKLEEKITDPKYKLHGKFKTFYEDKEKLISTVEIESEMHKKELLNFVKFLEIMPINNKFYIYTGFRLYVLPSDDVGICTSLIFNILYSYFLDYHPINRINPLNVLPLYHMILLNPAETVAAPAAAPADSPAKGGRKSRKGRKSRARKTRRKRGKRSRKNRKR